MTTEPPATVPPDGEPQAQAPETMFPPDNATVCTRCGDEFTDHPGMPHVCGGCMIGTGNQDAYDAGFAAGRAAATPNPPENPYPRGGIFRAAWAEGWAARAAASPDERLREAAAEALAAMESITPMALQRTKPERVEAHARWKDAHANLVAALAYGPYTPAEEGLPDPGPCADHAFLDGPDNPFAPHDSGHAIWRAGFNAGLVEQSRVIEGNDA